MDMASSPFMSALSMARHVQFGQSAAMTRKAKPINRIAELRTARGWSMQRLADEAGTSASQINKLEKSQRRLSDVWLRRLARALDCSQAELLGEAAPERAEKLAAPRSLRIRIVTQAGAGHSVIPLDEEDAVDYDEIPLSPEDRWIMVRGESQMPRYDDADYIRPPNTKEPPERGLFLECLVQLKDGRVMIKRVVPGTRKGRYTLESHNAEPIRDVAIEWVAPFRRRAIVIW